MDDYEHLQFDRDVDLINHLCYNQTALASYWEDWVRRELRGLISRTLLLEVMDLENSIGVELRRANESIASIDKNELPETLARLREQVRRVENELGEDPLKSHQILQDGLGGIAGLTRKLLEIRQMVDRLASQAKPD